MGTESEQSEKKSNGSANDEEARSRTTATEHAAHGALAGRDDASATRRRAWVPQEKEEGYRYRGNVAVGESALAAAAAAELSLHSFTQHARAEEPNGGAEEEAKSR